MKSNNPLVSAIVPTRNSAKTLDICLKSVMKQTYPNVEIIVVDNHSSDNTLKIAKKYTKKVFLKGPERSAQRNYGVKMSEGEYLIFLDSDIELSKNVVSECVKKVKKSCGVITFPEIIIASGFWGKCRKLEAKCYLGDDTIEAPRFYEKKIFNKLGGFDENLIAAEDWDLRERALEMGIKIYHINSLTYHHEGKVNFFKRLKKKHYYGKNLYNYIKKNSKIKNKIPIFRKCYLRNWKLLIRNPIYTLGFFVMKFSESFVVLFSIIKSRIYKKV